VQPVVFRIVARIIPGNAQDVPSGKVVQGAFLGAISLATGILNAACMTC
jgi:uncharacterized membrane protein YjfL (UPF0719 family)